MITHQNAMRVFNYDPFTTMGGRENCTVGALRELGKEDDRIMGPALRHADGLDAGRFRSHRKPHDHVGARFERRESDADAHAATLATDRPVVNRCRVATRSAAYTASRARDLRADAGAACR